jgi:hypothetical protein
MGQDTLRLMPHDIVNPVREVPHGRASGAHFGMRWQGPRLARRRRTLWPLAVHFVFPRTHCELNVLYIMILPQHHNHWNPIASRQVLTNQR